MLKIHAKHRVLQWLWTIFMGRIKTKSSSVRLLWPPLARSCRCNFLTFLKTEAKQNITALTGTESNESKID